MASMQRVAMILGAVVLLPSACVLGVLALGRQLDESQVAEGTLLSPGERARRAEAYRQRFLAMTPAEHLASARAAVVEIEAAGYRADIGRARPHLEAIGADAGLGAEVQALEARLTAVRERVYGGFEAAVITAVASSGAQDSVAARAAVVAQLRARTSAPCIHERDPGGTALQIGGMYCDVGMVERLVRGRARAALQQAGFRQVRCEFHESQTTRAL
ncbi:MAG: hypothetical protein JNK72_15360 [Myxococcales bacterium]|nr:hypothetical protein [Myxococcales bacterium]